jgi:hypothetical protein
LKIPENIRARQLHYIQKKILNIASLEFKKTLKQVEGEAAHEATEDFTTAASTAHVERAFVCVFATGSSMRYSR